MGNEHLRVAMATARVDMDALVTATGVDPKTCQRWIAGRTPYPRHRRVIADLLGEDEGHLWPQTAEPVTYGARFRKLWQTASNEGDAVGKVQRSLGAALSGQLVNIEQSAAIKIELDGTAVIEQAYFCANASYTPLMTLTRDMWFEQPQHEIFLRARCDRSVPMQVQIIRDFPNYKQFICNFVKPVQPLEIFSFSYCYRAERMFLADHFWDQRTLALTRLLAVSINHSKGRPLKSAAVMEELQSGPMQDQDPDLTIVQLDETACNIRWKKDFPGINGIYRISWSFDG